MPQSLREMIPGYNPGAGLNDMIPGYAPTPTAPTLRGPDVQPLQDQADANSSGEFGKALDYSRMGGDIGSLAAKESSLRAAGDAAGGNALRQQITELQGRQQLFAPRVGRLRDIHGVGDAGDWFMGQAGNATGSSIAPMALGTAIGAAGTVAGFVPHPIAQGLSKALKVAGPLAMGGMFYPQMKGDAYSAMAEDPTIMANKTPQEIDNMASLAGAGNAALGMVTPSLLARKFGGAGLATGATSKLGILAHTGIGAVDQGLAGMGQTALTDQAMGYMNPAHKGATGEDYLDAFAGGAAGIVPQALAGHVADAGYRRLGIRGDGKKGDALPLNDGAPLGEKPPADLGQHLADGPDPARAGAAAIDKNSLMQGTPPEGQSATEDMNWFLNKAPERRNVILGELDKMPKDPVAQDLATKLRAVDLTDPMNGADSAIDEAGAYAAKMSGIAQAAGQASQNVRKAAEAATKNKPKNSLEEGQPVPASDMGSSTGADVGGVKVNDATSLSPGPAERAAIVARRQLTTDILTSKAHEQGHRGTADLIDNLSGEISAMAGQTKSGEGKPTDGDMARANRVGSMLSDLLGPNAAEVVKHLGRTNKAESSPTFQAMLDRVVSGKPEPMERSKAADGMAALIPPDVESRLLAKGIDLSNPATKEHFLSNMEDFSDGTSGFSLDQAHKLLGKPTFDSIMEYVGRPIEERQNKKTKGDTLVDDTNQPARDPLSSDDAGGSESKMNDGARSAEGQNAFEVAGEEKSHNAIPPESMAFHHGTKEGTVRASADAFKEIKNKNGEMVLPTLLRADTETAKRASETDAQYAERTAPGGAEKGLTARLGELRGKAESSLGKMRDRYVVAATSARELMDRQNLQPSKRAEMFFKYAEKEKNPHVVELREMHKALSDLTYMDNAMSDTVVNRTSLSPSGEKLTIAQRAEINSPKINLERLSELIPPKDMDKVLELSRNEKASRAVYDQASGTYSKSGTVPKSVGIAKIIHAAKLAAEKHMNETMAQDPAIKSYMDKVQKEQGRSPEFHEVVNNFFDSHHLVTAEQASNRDHLQMNLTEFRDMATKGAANLKSSGLAVKELGYGNEATHGEMLRREASMNLIRFSSEHSRAADQQVAVPAYKLVAWVRDMRNAHETHLEEGGGDVRGKSKNETRQTEDYKRDLLEGITAMMQNGLTDGLPYIINAKGERENFGQAGKLEKQANPNSAPSQGRLFGHWAESKGALPPSLDLNGITDAKAMKDRAFSSKKRREEAAEHVASQSSLNEQRGKDEKQAAKDKELSREPSDVQTAEAAAKAEEEAGGSKTRDAQREDVKLQSSIKNSAADAALKPLSLGRALNSAGKIAETLWRDYTPKGLNKEAHAKALDRIMAYVRSIDRPGFVEGEPHTMTGGKQYALPLAALLTPRHMAEIQDRHPGELSQFQALRSRVAHELLNMAKPDSGRATISTGELGKMVDFLSGHNDKVSQERLDKIAPTDPVQLKEWNSDKATRLKWDGERIKSADREAFLEGLAKDHVESMKSGATEAGPENSTFKGEKATATENLPPEQAAKRLEAIKRAEQKVADLREQITSLREADPATGLPPAERKAQIAQMAAEITKINAKLNERVPSALGTGAEGSSQTETKTTTIRERLIERNKKPAEREPYDPLGVGKSTDANDRRFLSAETVESRTAETNARNDAATKTVGKLVDQAKAEPMKAKSEGLLTNPPEAPAKFQAKETAKLAGADLVLAPTTPEGYAGDLGRAAREEGKLYTAKAYPDMTGKTLLVSVPGKGRDFGAMPELIKRVKGALESGAEVLTDNYDHATRSHNAEGEGALRSALIEAGYKEKSGPEFSTWSKDSEPAAKPTEPTGLLQKSIDKRQEYLNNPPDNYSTEVAKGHLDWATGQKERVDAEYKKAVAAGDADRQDQFSDLRGSLNRLIEKGKSVLEGDKSLEKVEGKPAVDFYADIAKVEAEIERLYKDTEGKPGKKRDREIDGKVAPLQARLDAWRSDMAASRDEIYSAERLAAMSPEELKGTLKKLKKEHDEDGAGAWDYDSGDSTTLSDALDNAINRAETELDRRGKVKNNEQIVDAGKKEASPMDAWKKGPTAEAQNAAAKMEATEAPSNKDVFMAKTYIGKVLGPKVQALFEEHFPGMKGSADWTDAKQMIRIATGSPVSVMQRAYHESMHGFFSNILKNSPEAKALLERVMTDPKMQERLESMLKDSPKAIESMRADPEERVAYAYQFWAAGMLDVGTKPTTFFEKVQSFMRKVLGSVRETDKALAIFQSFHDGKLTEPSAAGIAIAKVMATGEWRAKFMQRFDKQAQAVYHEVMTAHDGLRTSESETLRGLSTDFWSNPGDPDSAGRRGVIDSTSEYTKKYESRLDTILDRLSGENQDRDYKALVDHMNGSKDSVSKDISDTGIELHKLLDDYYDYAKTAGLKMGERDKKNFWPVVWSMENMIENKDAFVNMLVKEYPANLRQALSIIQKTDPTVTSHQQVAEAIHQAIIDRGGVDNGALTAHREDGILNPYFASQNKRSFDWIAPEHRQPFLSTDVVATATRYLHQGVRAAEYVRVFGEGGQLLKDKMASKDDVQMTTKDGDVLYEKDGPVVTELKEAAAKLKLTGKESDEWVARRMEDAQRNMGAMEGVLGKDISAGMRKAQSAIMVYQGLRVLSLSLFSAMLDPNGIKIAGGTTQNMLDAYVHGLKNVVGTWKDILTGDKLTTRGNEKDLANAATVGAIAPTMFLEQKGAAHTSEYTAGPARKINRGLFLANGLTAWDRSMRIMATKAAMESIASNEKNASPEHSQRWLKELGLKQGEVTLDMDGKLMIDRDSIAAQKGISKEEATAEAQRVHTAVNRWVNRAIVSPNAAQRPARASDPHFAMFYQLKQFTYSFQKTTMTYALNEAKAGNMAPSAQLLMGMPIMIAADVSKAILTGGGSLPGYMANWTMADWVAHAWNRAGLSGTAQFGIDSLHDPLGTLGGPTISQGVNALTHPIGETILGAIPGVNKLGGIAQAVKDLE